MDDEDAIALFLLFHRVVVIACCLPLTSISSLPPALNRLVAHCLPIVSCTFGLISIESSYSVCDGYTSSPPCYCQCCRARPVGNAPSSS